MGVKAIGIRGRLLVAAAMGAMVIATPAMADDGRRQDYNVEAGDLGDALRTVSRQSGREIIFSGKAVAGMRAPRLHGSFSADEAVRALLAGTGLIAEFRKDVVIIRGRSEASGETSDRPTEVQDILVTGSRIRGSQGTSPVISATREQVLLSGQSGLGDYIRSIPQNYNGGQNPSVAGGGNQGGSNNNVNGSSNLNLRGLGADATLTLINGHRVAYDAVGAGVDISAIPLAAVDRIEIVADGASAIYGSDAVAGVANVLLRRDFNGLTTSARIGGSTEGGNFQQQYDLVGGKRWGSGGALVALDFSRSTAINASDRSYTRQIDGSTTLYPKLKQYSAVLAGHQAIAPGVTLEIDGQYSHRTSEVNFPYLPDKDVTVEGLRSQPTVESYSITPTLRISLPARWQLSLSGTHGQSKSHLLSHIYSGGEELALIGIQYDGRIDSGEISGEGPLAQLPGGELRFAVGTGYRSVGLDASSRRTLFGTTTTTLDISPIRENYYAYGELSIPLVGPENSRPLLNRLRLTAASRYENYRGVGDLATPKLGVIYEPHRAIAIKATWGKSFKAPTLFEQYQATQGTLIRGTGFQNNLGGRPALLLYGGGRDLGPEKATTWTTSVEVKPLPGLRIEASYFDVRFRQRIVEAIGDTNRAFGNPMFDGLILYNPSEQQVLAALATLDTPLLNASGQPLNAANISAIFDDRLQNISRQHTRGVDLSASYDREFGPGEHLNLMGSVSYLEGNRQLSPGQPTTKLVGRIFNPPHWRARGGVNWTQRDVTFAGYANYTGGTNDDVILPAEDVGSFTTVDATIRYAPKGAQGVLHGLELALSATNIFNEKPSPIRTSDPIAIPYDSTNTSVTGRVISFTITKSW
ncbi:TonB-dependent receptor [Sphingobium sp. H39-3-25]|uniref:TonB-dependent receptor n=1 Tax=Sphingomonadales TaxID=204457 RepID=UPI00082CEB03|nr:MULTISPECIES: TonB-dependent receptor [Sphingomonadaceae]MDF0491136.1 TonB-dependent receptor [Sphingomonas pollutisoli]MDF0545132.1 TonB-dependent receptor [Sphingobium arseniciresistens]